MSPWPVPGAARPRGGGWRKSLARTAAAPRELGARVVDILLLFDFFYR